MICNSSKHHMQLRLWNAKGNVSWAWPSLRLNHRWDNHFREHLLQLLVEGRRGYIEEV